VAQATPRQNFRKENAKKTPPEQFMGENVGCA
jgi:hypothetical protein